MTDNLFHFHWSSFPVKSKRADHYLRNELLICIQGWAADDFTVFILPLPNLQGSSSASESSPSREAAPLEGIIEDMQFRIKRLERWHTINTVLTIPSVTPVCFDLDFTQVWTLFGTLNACFSNEIDFWKWHLWTIWASPNLLPFVATMGSNIWSDGPYFFLSKATVSVFVFLREILISIQRFRTFGIETGRSLCHLVEKKCNPVPTV